MPTASDFVFALLSQDGDRYVFGAPAKRSDSNPKAFDCSSLVRWACDRVGVVPAMPAGSWHQATHCRKHNTLITPDKAIQTAGALLFYFSSSPFQGVRPKSAHVAISLGNGKTIEARNARMGVGRFSALNRAWVLGAHVPGLTH